VTAGPDFDVALVGYHTDAQGEASCSIRDDQFTVSGQGVHTDIIMASALAYVNALNKLDYRHRHHQRVADVGP
jgi:2-isopropylmalate synthase